MAGTATIKEIRERTAKAVAARPKIGQSTSVSRAVITNGFRCEVTEDDWTLVVDMPEVMAGTNKGPTPGVLGRGALGSCLAIGIVGWAAQLDIPLTALTVNVEADWDVRGEFGIDDAINPGYGALRVRIDVSSPAPAKDVHAMLAEAQRHSPYLDVFRRANDVTVETALSESADEA